jgi:HSP20 family protein
MDLVEESDRFVVTVDLPGSKESEISVTLEGDVLRISALSKEEATQEDQNRILRKERRIGRFERAVTLPAPVLQHSLDSKYEDGVLTITIEKEKGGAQS